MSSSEIDLVKGIFPNAVPVGIASITFGGIFTIYHNQKAFTSHLPIFPVLQWAKNRSGFYTSFRASYTNCQDLYGLLLYIKKYMPKEVSPHWVNKQDCSENLSSPKFRVAHHTGGTLKTFRVQFRFNFVSTFSDIEGFSSLEKAMTFVEVASNILDQAYLSCLTNQRHFYRIIAHGDHWKVNKAFFLCPYHTTLATLGYFDEN